MRNSENQAGYTCSAAQQNERSLSLQTTHNVSLRLLCTLAHYGKDPHTTLFDIIIAKEEAKEDYFE